LLVNLYMFLMSKEDEKLYHSIFYQLIYFLSRSEYSDSPIQILGKRLSATETQEKVISNQ